MTATMTSTTTFNVRTSSVTVLSGMNPEAFAAEVDSMLAAFARNGRPFADWVAGRVDRSARYGAYIQRLQRMRFVDAAADLAAQPTFEVDGIRYILVPALDLYASYEACWSAFA